MAARDTAEIAVRPDGTQYIYNVSTTDEADYELLREWWPLLTGMELRWLSELEPAEPYAPPPWLKWFLGPDGWLPPEDGPL